MFQTATRCQLCGFGDAGRVIATGIDTDVGNLVEIGKQVPDETFPDLLIEMVLIHMDDDTFVRLYLVGVYREIDIVDTGFDASGLLPPTFQWPIFSFCHAGYGTPSIASHPIVLAILSASFLYGPPLRAHF